MARLSVIVLTLNEEKNIAACLDTVRWADEIIVVDSGSTDRTTDIARGYTPHVVTIDWEGYGAARNTGNALATGEWILWLDADERVTPGLAEEIRAILREDRPDVSGYRIARRAYFLGRWIRHSGWYPSRVTRLFRRGRGRSTESRVHEHLEVDGPLRPTAHDLLHYTDPTLEHYLAKSNAYTSLAARDLAARGRRATLFDLFLRPPFQFVKMYLLRRGFLDGMEGLILAILSSAYVFTKYAKLRELRAGGKPDGGHGEGPPGDAQERTP
jgi:glycosyltransferase involved in cell wall biosynthesis